MEKYAWRAVIIKGQEEEYKRRHDNIWPELKEDKIEEMADHILANDATDEPWMFAPIGKAALISILKESM